MTTISTETLEKIVGSFLVNDPISYVLIGSEEVTLAEAASALEHGRSIRVFGTLTQRTEEESAQDGIDMKMSGNKLVINLFWIRSTEQYGSYTYHLGEDLVAL
jgi:hypothetical protein